MQVYIKKSKKIDDFLKILLEMDNVFKGVYEGFKEGFEEGIKMYLEELKKSQEKDLNQIQGIFNQIESDMKQNIDKEINRSFSAIVFEGIIRKHLEEGEPLSNAKNKIISELRSIYILKKEKKEIEKEIDILLFDKIEVLYTLPDMRFIFILGDSKELEELGDDIFNEAILSYFKNEVLGRVIELYKRDLNYYRKLGTQMGVAYGQANLVKMLSRRIMGGGNIIV